MDQWIPVLLRRWRNGILPSMWKAESTKKLESSGAALTQSVELMLDVQERFATVPNGPVADRVTAKLKAVLDKNPGFYVLKQVSNVLSGTDSKIPVTFGVPINGVKERAYIQGNPQIQQRRTLLRREVHIARRLRCLINRSPSEPLLHGAAFYVCRKREQATLTRSLIVLILLIRI
ncbi:hypothetical protein HPB50_016930 [Hyalomma asiaticum]|uniref:Uncharacterized protein n=1 Tax=Hyalomma asiaticum TaxID=266040 RepID=A0ACB7SZV4_HYAAI|nr:hypothetical protein HPB50_016930 [Hyalomma asiaticum]